MLPYSGAENHAFCSSIREDRAVCPDSFMLKCRSTEISACRLGGRFFLFYPPLWCTLEAATAFRRKKKKLVPHPHGCSVQRAGFSSFNVSSCFSLSHLRACSPTPATTTTITTFSLHHISARCSQPSSFIPSSPFCFVAFMPLPTSTPPPMPRTSQPPLPVPIPVSPLYQRLLPFSPSSI